MNMLILISFKMTSKNTSFAVWCLTYSQDLGVLNSIEFNEL